MAEVHQYENGWNGECGAYVQTPEGEEYCGEASVHRSHTHNFTPPVGSETCLCGEPRDSACHPHERPVVAEPDWKRRFMMLVEAIDFALESGAMTGTEAEKRLKATLRKYGDAAHG